MPPHNSLFCFAAMVGKQGNRRMLQLHDYAVNNEKSKAISTLGNNALAVCNAKDDEVYNFCVLKILLGKYYVISISFVEKLIVRWF